MEWRCADNWHHEAGVGLHNLLKYSRGAAYNEWPGFFSEFRMESDQ